MHELQATKQNHLNIVRSW